jgi:hypothetical protein
MHHRAEVAREAAQRHLSEKHAEDRDLELQRIDDRSHSLLVLDLPPHEESDDAEHDHYRHQDTRSVREEHEEAGRSGQRPAQVLEHLGKDRHDEQQHHHHAEDGHHEDDDRVGHGRLDLAAQSDFGLVVLRDLHQHRVEEAADLTGLAHVDHERREDLRVLRE